MTKDMHYTEYLNRVRGCILGLGDMTWIEPALRVVAKHGADFTGEQLAAAYNASGALTPHFLRNMARGITPPLAVFDDPERGGPGGMDCAPLWACVCPGDPERAMEYAARDASVDHVGEAVEAAQFLAAAMALAFVRGSAQACLIEAAALLREESRIARLVLDACALCGDNPGEARARMDWRYGGVDGSLLPRLAQMLLSLLLSDVPDRLAAAFQGILTGTESVSDVSDAAAARVSRAGLSCMEMRARRGGELPVRVTSAPFVAVPGDAQPVSRITVTYMGPPVLRPGHARQCMLNIVNCGKQALEGPITYEAQGSVQALTAAQAKVLPGQTAHIPFTVWMPEDVDTVCESNRLSVSFAGLTHTFGVAGAQGWRVCGCMGLAEKSVYEGRGLPERPLWEPCFIEDSRIKLDALNGWVGPCSFVLERTLVIRRDIRVDVEVRRTCPFALELDGQTLLRGEGTDGWALAAAQEPGVELTVGEHTLRLTLDRRSPGGSIEVALLCGGALLAVESKNPKKG